MKKQLFFFLLLLCVLPTWGQDYTLLLRPSAEGMHLRWVPQNFTAWNEHLTTGYQLERSLNGAPFSPLASSVLPGLPANSRMDTLLQSLISFQDSLPVVRALPEGPRLLAGTYQAFLSGIATMPEGIQQSGLYFLDKTAQPGQKYRYRLRSAQGALLAENGQESVSMPLPMLTLEDEEYVANVKWNQDQGLAEFQAFRLERSEGASAFISRPDAWIFPRNVLGLNQVSRDTFQLRDTVQTLNTTYNYRLVGISPFGEKVIGEPVQFTSLDQTPPARPKGIDVEVAADKSAVSISWEADELTTDLVGYQLYRSRFPDSAYARLNSQLVSADMNSFTDESITPAGEYYYRVAAIDEAGNERSSFRKSAVFPDKTPPAVPAGLTFTIDKAGIANIQWAANIEPDLRGYQLTIARFAEDEFVPVRSKLITQPNYQDTLALNFENREIFYRVAALDQMGNLSKFSPPVKGLLPDTISPLVPVLEAPERKENTLTLRWQTGREQDLAYVEVFRRHPDNANWSPGVRVDNGNEFKMTGLDTMSGRWVFAVQAVDASGNRSILSNERLLKVQERMVVTVPTELKVEDLKGEDKALRWEYPGVKTPVSFLVFRLQNGSNKPVLQGKTSEMSFTISPETGKSRYAYFIIAQDKDSRLSGASAQLEVVL